MTKIPRDRSFIITADMCQWNGKVMSHGTRLAVELPQEVVKALILREGSPVRITVTDVLDTGI